MIYRQDQHCQFCKHYLGERQCLAFPQQIPAELWSGENWHKEPFPNDQGYRFERKFVEWPEIPQETFEKWAKESNEG